MSLSLFELIQSLGILFSISFSAFAVYLNFAKPRLKLNVYYEPFDYDKEISKVFTEPVHNVVFEFVNKSSKPITIIQIECSYVDNSSTNSVNVLSGVILNSFIHESLKKAYGSTLFQSQKTSVKINDSKVLKYLDSVCVVSSYGHRYYLDRDKLKEVLKERDDKINK